VCCEQSLTNTFLPPLPKHQSIYGVFHIPHNPLHWALLTKYQDSRVNRLICCPSSVCNCLTLPLLREFNLINYYYLLLLISFNPLLVWRPLVTFAICTPCIASFPSRIGCHGARSCWSCLKRSSCLLCSWSLCALCSWKPTASALSGDATSTWLSGSNTCAVCCRA